MDGNGDIDCLVIGAGPGGLIAATYLGRYHRPPLVVDSGASRAAWIPTSHNVPGFPTGLSGRALLALLREQAERYGAVIRRGRVDGLERDGDGRFHAGGEGVDVRARRVILATGVDDEVPALSTLADGILSARVRLCPVCDGYEVTGHRVGVLGPPERAFREALFLTTYTSALTMLRLPDQPEPTRDDLERAAAAGIAVEPEPLVSIAAGDAGVTVRLAGGRTAGFDDVYVAMGGRPRSGLAARLGARASPSGYVETDGHQRTSIPGLYAVGDVVHELNQIAVAAGHAAVAATDVHNGLCREARGEAPAWPGEADGG